LIDNDYQPFYVGDLLPSVMTYSRAIEIYQKSIEAGDFYEEPLSDDLVYPDW
tara:strand:+ start:3047 stop:3202 length:156 start_codon:yes stop_codon:yes gene_type:complete